MLTHPTIDKLQALKFTGMAKALQEQLNTKDIQELSFEERIGLLVDREETERSNRRLKSRLKKAKLRLMASIEDINFRTPRGLDKSQIMSLASCDWLHNKQNLLMTGPTGVGKTYLACAFGNKACREGFSALYFRLSRLLQKLSMARLDGSYGKLLTSLAKTDLIILDDWGLPPLDNDQRRDLLEIFEDRYKTRSTLIASQIPQEHWHEYINDQTIADAILDRLIHNAQQIIMDGDSMRKSN